MGDEKNYDCLITQIFCVASIVEQRLFDFMFIVSLTYGIVPLFNRLFYLFFRR
jgi:hypothetical protein